MKIKMETSVVSERFCLQEDREYDVTDSLGRELVGNKQAVAMGKTPRPANRLNQETKAGAVT